MNEVYLLKQIQYISGELSPFLYTKRKNGRLALGKCRTGLIQVLGGCLAGVWRVSCGCLARVWRGSGGCVAVVWQVSGGCWSAFRLVSNACQTLVSDGCQIGV